MHVPQVLHRRSQEPAVVVHHRQVLPGRRREPVLVELQHGGSRDGRQHRRVRRQQHLGPRFGGQLGQQSDQHQQALEGQPGLRLVQHEEAAVDEPVGGEHGEERLAVAELVEHRLVAPGMVLQIAEQTVHGLRPQEVAPARRSRVAGELQALAQGRLRRPGGVPRPGRTALRGQPERHRHALDDGRLPGAVLAHQDGQPVEVEAVVQQLAHRGQGGRPAVPPERVVVSLGDAADGMPLGQPTARRLARCSPPVRPYAAESTAQTFGSPASSWRAITIRCTWLVPS